MRTNIVIDDKLMKEALRATGLKTKRAAVELLLYSDRDFDPFVKHLGLRSAMSE